MMVAGYKDSGAITPRMAQVAACGARGLSAKQTAAELAIAEATVVSIRKALCARLGAPNFTAACVSVALRRQEAA
jgi:DNA-binding CsgD family transcriptional regulator